MTMIDDLSSLHTIAFVAITIAAMILAAPFLFSKKKKSAFDPVEFKPFKLAKKEIISHDTRRFTFDLQTPQTMLGLPVGQHITLRYKDKDGKGVQRSYTPISGDETLGSVVFVIKVYKANEHPKFPDGGKMSQHLDSLKVGDTIDMRGPKGHMEYLGRGQFTVKLLRKPLEERRAKHFGMIAGGTGITPMLQVANAIFKDSKDKTTTISLLYANKTEGDILVSEELKSLQEKYPDRFKLHYTLDTPPADWKGSTGFVNKEMLENYVVKGVDVETTQVLMCGPPPMIKFACIPNLEALGYTEKNWFSF